MLLEKITGGPSGPLGIIYFFKKSKLTNRLGQKTPLIKVSYSKQKPKVKHFLGIFFNNIVHTINIDIHFQIKLETSWAPKY
jgi:hypothetical protein